MPSQKLPTAHQEQFWGLVSCSRIRPHVSQFCPRGAGIQTNNLLLTSQPALATELQPPQQHDLDFPWQMILDMTSSYIIAETNKGQQNGIPHSYEHNTHSEKVWLPGRQRDIQLSFESIVTGKSGFLTKYIPIFRHLYSSCLNKRIKEIIYTVGKEQMSSWLCPSFIWLSFFFSMLLRSNCIRTRHVHLRGTS